MVHFNSMEQLPTSNTQGTKQGSGCVLAGGVGCLILVLFVFALFLIGGIVAYFTMVSHDTVVPRPINNNYNTNYSGNYNYDYNSNVNTSEIENLTDPMEQYSDLNAYQVYAYPTSHIALTSYPSIRATIEHQEMSPLVEGDHGFLWVGAILDNGYFIQVGLITSQYLNENGTMQWDYFWEMWDDQGVYQEGEQASLDYQQWDENETNQFTLTCQDPNTGTWEFWVNGTTIGTVTTGDCNTNLDNVSLTWEVVTNKTPVDALPVFGPFKLNNLQYWDGEKNWYDVEEAGIGYGYGAVSEGTIQDQASVCPPYGAESLKKGFLAGSTLSCLTSGELLWAK